MTRSSVRNAPTAPRVVESLIAANAPAPIVGVLEALQFQDASLQRLANLTGSEWSELLSWCDSRQLTLLLPVIACSVIPASVAGEIEQKAARYGARYARLKSDLFEIGAALDDAGLEFVLLKGMSHAPALSPLAEVRAQGDIDLWLPGEPVYEARNILAARGYMPVLCSKSRHLGPMIRPSDWRWRGDLFDPDMPISVELHYELWSDEAEFISAPGLEWFWKRKEPRYFDGHRMYVLCEEDLIGFAALHLLLHVLHGDLPLQRAWELARFLHMRAGEGAFWKLWSNSHPESLRQLEVTIFALVASWFQCRLPEAVMEEFEKLPACARLWLEEYSASPLMREWAPNKHELWLHLSLIDNRNDKARVLFRRLFPASLPAFHDGGNFSSSPLAKGFRLLRQFRFFWRRLSRHVGTFAPTLRDGLRWWKLSRS